jgi:hypothetical protein
MHTGSCHCGQIKFEVEGAPDQAMECNCSHCSRKGYLLWFIPRSQMTLLAGGDAMGTYRFNKHIIDHHFCPTCGCAPFGFGVDRSGAATAAINVRCLEDVELSAIKRLPFDGRSR